MKNRRKGFQTSWSKVNDVEGGATVRRRQSVRIARVEAQQAALGVIANPSDANYYYYVIGIGNPPETP